MIPAAGAKHALALTLPDAIPAVPADVVCRFIVTLYGPKGKGDADIRSVHLTGPPCPVRVTEQGTTGDDGLQGG